MDIRYPKNQKSISTQKLSLIFLPLPRFFCVPKDPNKNPMAFEDESLEAVPSGARGHGPHQLTVALGDSLPGGIYGNIWLNYD